MKTSVYTSKAAFASRPVNQANARSFRARAPSAAAPRRQSLQVAANWFEEGKKALAKMQAGNYDEAAINKKIDQAIKQNKVMMFSFVRCPFCIKAKNLLKEQNIPFEVIEVDQVPEGMAIRAELANRTGRTSVPNIWINGKNIGGFNDGTPGLNPLFQSGELLKLVKA